MDRLELRTKFAGKVIKLALPEFDLEVFVRSLYSSDKTKFFSLVGKLSKDTAGNVDTTPENLQLLGEMQCFVVSKGLVDEAGIRIYSDDETHSVAEEIPSMALETISEKIRELSGIGGKPGEDPIKNSVPIPNAALTSVLQ